MGTAANAAPGQPEGPNSGVSHIRVTRAVNAALRTPTIRDVLGQRIG